MVYYLFYGEIKKEHQDHWTEMSEPFDILSWDEDMHISDWITFLQTAKDYFSDEVQVDWGSFAWKATKDQLRSWERQTGGSLEHRERLQDGITYGVVFIEMP